MNLTTLTPRNGGAYNFHKLYLDGVDIIELFRSMLASSTGTTGGACNGSAGSVANSGAYLIEEDYVAKSSGNGYVEGNILHRYEVVDQSVTPPQSTVIWYNRSVSPDLKLTGEPTPGSVATTEAYAIGLLSDSPAALDGSGKASVISALKTLIVHQNTSASALSGILNRLPSLVSTSPADALPVKVVEQITQPATTIVTVEYYDAKVTSVNYSAMDVLKRTRTTTVATNAVVESWYNETTSSVIVMPLLIELKKRGIPDDKLRFGSVSLVPGGHFSGRQIEIVKGIFLNSISVDQISGTGTVYCNDGGTISLVAGTPVSAMAMAADEGRLIGGDFGVQCISGATQILYTYYASVGAPPNPAPAAMPGVLIIDASKTSLNMSL